jgi:nucleoside-diphosphate-sugar epimerase
MARTHAGNSRHAQVYQLTIVGQPAGVALRPGFIHGTRRWGSTQIPLSVIGSPLEAVINALPSQSLAKVPLAGAAFVPPVRVQTVAKAAVAAATDPNVPGGPMSVWDIATYK